MLKPQQCLRRVIRVKKADSAFVYQVLEAHEGITAYSTLEGAKNLLYRDLELLFTSDFCREVELMLDGLKGLYTDIDSK